MKKKNHFRINSFPPFSGDINAWDKRAFFCCGRNLRRPLPRQISAKHTNNFYFSSVFGSRFVSLYFARTHFGFREFARSGKRDRTNSALEKNDKMDYFSLCFPQLESSSNFRRADIQTCCTSNRRHCMTFDSSQLLANTQLGDSFSAYYGSATSQSVTN